MLKTEFYETAVQRGFYGTERSGLYGKKDNVRKYWEDVFIKLSIRPALEHILQQKEKIRVLDLGCGGGEGIELLTHIPPHDPLTTRHKDFLLTKADLELYKGIDISPAMINQGKENYPNYPQIQFLQADLGKGFPCTTDAPYDIYFSSYSSLSHLTYQELQQLTRQIFTHVGERGYMVFDLHGRFSPQWPKYWGASCQRQLPYNMAYLLPPDEQVPENFDWFNLTYWSGEELIQLIESTARATHRTAQILTIQDRSILVGRHMDTCIFKPERHYFRRQVNRLFDLDYRGELNKLDADLDYLNDVKDIHPQAWQRIVEYGRQWQKVVCMVQLLMSSKNAEVKKFIESQTELIAEELKMLAWLYRNAERFPVVDFWASIMGPQVACVLRNLELNLPRGLGCGHGLFCLVEIT